MRKTHCIIAVLAAALASWLPAPGHATQGAKKTEVMKETGEFTNDTPRDKVKKESPSKLYALRCVAGRTYTIDLSSDDFDAFLRLEDPSGKTILDDDDSGGGKTGHDARMVFKADKTATYTIAATSFGKVIQGKGKYTLTVFHDGAGPEKEIAYLVDVRGKLTKEDPKDKDRGSTCYCKTYPIDMSAKKTYVIQLDSKDFDAYLRLVNSDGKEVASDDDGAMDGLNARITYPCTKAGTYTIVATSCLYPDTGEFHLRAYVKE